MGVNEYFLKTSDSFVVADCCLKDEGKMIPRPSSLYVLKALEEFNNRLVPAYAGYVTNNKHLYTHLNGDVAKGKFCCMVIVEDLTTADEMDEITSILKDYGGWVTVCGDRTRIVVSPEALYTAEEQHAMEEEFLIRSGLFCPVCREFTTVVNGKRTCLRCRRSVGLHTGTEDLALGAVCTGEVSLLRKQVHGILDPLWKSPVNMSTTERKKLRFSLYLEIAWLLNIPLSYSHVAMQDKDACLNILKWAETLSRVCHKGNTVEHLREMYCQRCANLKLNSKNILKEI